MASINLNDLAVLIQTVMRAKEQQVSDNRGDNGRDPLDQNFRKFRYKIEWNTEIFWKLVSKSSRKSEYSENPVPFDNFFSGPVTHDPEIDKVQHAGNSSCSTVSASVLVLSSCG